MMFFRRSKVIAALKIANEKLLDESISQEAQIKRLMNKVRDLQKKNCKLKKQVEDLRGY